jgi:hypothetical protein
MDYFIYRITEKPFRQLEKIEQHTSFRSASLRVKALRAELPSASPVTVRMITAENQLQAEDLLNQLRVAGPDLGDD